MHFYQGAFRDPAHVLALPVLISIVHHHQWLLLRASCENPESLLNTIIPEELRPCAWSYKRNRQLSSPSLFTRHTFRDLNKSLLTDHVSQDKSAGEMYP